MPLPKSPFIRFRRSPSPLRLGASTPAHDHEAGRAGNWATFWDVARRLANNRRKIPPSPRVDFYQNEARSPFRINKTYQKRCQNEAKRSYGCDCALAARPGPVNSRAVKGLGQARGAKIEPFELATCARIGRLGANVAGSDQSGMPVRGKSTIRGYLSGLSGEDEKKRRAPAKKDSFKKWGEANPRVAQNQQLAQKQAPERTHRKSGGRRAAATPSGL
jgi:hypothetical protein